MREERGRKALGRGAVRYQIGPRQAECQVRYGGDVMRRVWRGWDGWSDDLGADDAAHPQSRGSKTGRRKPSSGWRTESPHGSVHVMTLARITTGINKAKDDGSQASYVSWLGSLGGNREPSGLIVV